MDEMKKIDEMLMAGKINPREADLLREAIKQAEEKKERILATMEERKTKPRWGINKWIGWIFFLVLMAIGTFVWIGGERMDRQFLFNLLVFGLFLWTGWELIFVWLRNRLVSLDEEVRERWAQVLALYRQKEDLVEKLIEVVEKQLGHEQKLTELITQARGHLRNHQNPKVDKANEVLNQVMGIVEAYPQVSTNQLAQEISRQITMLEQILTEARLSYNRAVRRYNSFAKGFPGNLLSKAEGKDYLQNF